MLLFNSHHRPWSVGASRYHSDPQRIRTVGVRCRLGSLENEDTALLDTGAEWSVIDDETAQLLSDDLGEALEPLVISTRLGKAEGNIHRLTITLLADGDLGHDVKIDASVAILRNWKGPIVLGYRGFLERLRFALDPGNRPNEQFVHFGPVE